MAAPESLIPVSIKREGDGLAFEWSDGLRGYITWSKLRNNCPCATCLDDRAKPPNPLRVLSERELKAGKAVPVQMVARGHYAYQIVWNDGHDTGIYTLELLRQLSDTQN